MGVDSMVAAGAPPKWEDLVTGDDFSPATKVSLSLFVGNFIDDGLKVDLRCFRR